MQIKKITLSQGVNQGVNKGVNKGVNNQGANRKSNVSFGYDPVINAELIKAFESTKKNKAFFSIMEDLVCLVNQTENELRNAEKSGKTTLTAMLAMAFIPLKTCVTKIVDSMFPDSDYRCTELEAYSNEVYSNNIDKEKPEHWLNTIKNNLQEQELQYQAEQATQDIMTIFSQKYPKVSLDPNDLTEALKQKYVNDMVEDDEDEDDTSDNVVPKKSLSDSIKLGKSIASQYIPTTKNEKMGFESLGGMKELKETLMKKIVIPLRDIKQARYNEEHYGIKMPNGILFYGPPGTGKTTIVQRLSVEAGLPLLMLKADKLSSQWVGQTEQNLGGVFDYAASIATEEKPVILLIDDVDGIVSKRNGNTDARDKKLMQIFLDRTQDALKNNVIVMAATNCYDNVDKAFLSRLRTQIYLGLQDEEGRKSIINMMLNQTDNGKNLANDEKAIDRITKLTEGFPTRAIEDFVNEAREKAQIDFYHHRDIELSDFEEIIAKPESQNKKINEDLYKTKATRKSIGFGNPKTIVGGPKTII